MHSDQGYIIASNQLFINSLSPIYISGLFHLHIGTEISLPLYTRYTIPIYHYDNQPRTAMNYIISYMMKQSSDNHYQQLLGKYWNNDINQEMITLLNERYVSGASRW